MTRMNHAVWSLIAIALSGTASAEIYKEATPTDTGFDFVWWPIVTVPHGWLHDDGASHAQHVNALIPKGTTFANAPAVIYAEAVYKPRMPDTKSLTQFIADDISDH
jgi:hypothetical protein